MYVLLRILHVMTHVLPARRSSGLAGRLARRRRTAADGAGFLRAGHLAVAHALRVADGADPVGASGGRPGRRAPPALARAGPGRSEEHKSALQSLMRSSYAVFCLKKHSQHNTSFQRLTSRTK